MSVKVRQYRNGEAFEIDIRTRLPGGRRIRERLKSPVTGKLASLRWGQEREAALAAGGGTGGNGPTSPAPTFAAFAKRFFEEFVRGEHYKPAGVYAKFRILRAHLPPRLGTKRLDEITTQVVDALKAELKDHKPATVNTILAVLRKMLEVAVRWGVLDRHPCRVEFLKVEQPPFAFYDAGEFGRLVHAATELDSRAATMVLLGGDAGLRRGEMMGLEWPDVDFERRIIRVVRSVWRDIKTLPKSGKVRTVPLTKKLHEALARLRDDAHFGAAANPKDLGILKTNGSLPVRRYDITRWMKTAQKIAGLGGKGGVHILRHTFCSRLAIRGVPVRVIQEYAGHATIMVTMRYMHLSPSVKMDAIKALDDE